MNLDLGRVVQQLAQPIRVALAFVGFLLVWEVFVHLTGIKSYILPAPSEIMTAMWDKAPRLAKAASFTVPPVL